LATGFIFINWLRVSRWWRKAIKRQILIAKTSPSLENGENKTSDTQAALVRRKHRFHWGLAKFASRENPQPVG
jgi:hypothetical protein